MLLLNLKKSGLAVEGEVDVTEGTENVSGSHHRPLCKPLPAPRITAAHRGHPLLLVQGGGKRSGAAWQLPRGLLIHRLPETVAHRVDVKPPRPLLVRWIRQSWSELSSSRRVIVTMNQY